RFKIDIDGGWDMSAHGNIVDHEYEIERDGDTVATISKRLFRIRDTYGVDIEPGQDDAMILAMGCVARRRRRRSHPGCGGGRAGLRDGDVGDRGADAQAAAVVCVSARRSRA